MKSIAELKNMVIGPSDLNKTMHYFFDLVDNNTLSHAGDPITPGKIKKNLEVQAIVNCMEGLLTQSFGEKKRVHQPVLFELPRERMFHGFCKTKIDHLPMSIVYFSDIKVGVFVITGLNNKTDYFRFALMTASNKAH